MNADKLSAAKVSIFANLALIVLKLSVAAYTGSLGILAEFAHSFFDFLASLLAYVGIRKAEAPADETHHYGHEKFENISSLLQTILIAVTSLAILWEASKKLSAGAHEVTAGWLGLAAMLIALGADYAVSRYLHRIAEKSGSPALEADAYHFTTDIWSTLAVIAGLLFASLGFHIADIIAGVVVAFVMLYLSFKLGKKSFLVMTDKAPDPEAMERVVQILSSNPRIRGYHSLRGRVAGSMLFFDVSVHLPPRTPLEEAHSIAAEIEEKIKEKVPFTREVVVHIEPTSAHDEEEAIEKVFG